MNRIIIVTLVLSVLIPVVSADALEYSIGVDWQLSAQVGVMSHLSDRISLQGALGVSMMGLIAAEAFAAYRLPLFDPPWSTYVLLGIPNFLIVPTLEGAMLSLGGAFDVERDLSDSFALHLKLGAGYPFFFEEGRDTVRDTLFPLGLWPEASLVMYYRPSSSIR
ncbi:MAG: hypothetical protein JXK93_10405 [Sphaerochaetaceae bacterium]|nr:hypothetical protein [Sphaerochaetaceae bacterium]